MSHNKPKIVFFGTPQFAVPALEKLIESGFDIAAVVTREDKPQGRKKELTHPPVKVTAVKHNIPVLQPEKITDEFISEVNQLKPNLFVIVAYGKILPQSLLDIPEHGSINIHPSLLPLYRGPSPLQAQLLDGVTETGVSIMLIDEEMDHGPLLADFKLNIEDSETTETLGEKLFKIGADNLPEVINQYISGEITPQEQDHDTATYCKMIKKENGEIDWSKPAEHIERMTRAFSPWPGAFSTLSSRGNEMTAAIPKITSATPRNDELAIKTLTAAVSEKTSDNTPGTFFAEEGHLYATCGDNTTLEVTSIQPAGKKPMSGTDFIRGYLN